MKKIIFIGVVFLLLSCVAMSGVFKRKNKAMTRGEYNQITITGSTRNISGHAAIVADNAAIYYVDGMNKWEKEWLHQLVKITGDLTDKENRSPGTIRSAVVMLLGPEEPEYSY